MLSEKQIEEGARALANSLRERKRPPEAKIILFPRRKRAKYQALPRALP